MKKEILEKIDLLVEMSGSTNSYENLQEEYTTLLQEIEHKKSQLKVLKRTVSSSKYIKSNERIIDENIKIGLENRCDDLNQSLDDLLDVISQESLKEENIHDKIASLEGDLTQLKRYIDSLNLKIKASKDKDSTYQNYESLLDSAYQEKEELEKELKGLESSYAKITLNLANLGTEKAELELKISQDKDKLNEINASLQNPNSYVDTKALKRDEELIDAFTQDLEDLEKKKLEVLCDAVYIGHEAQELYLDNDIANALSKIKELVTIVESRPYMNVKENELDEILAQAEQKRDEFASEIENKKYDGSDLSILQKRISYLEEEIKNCEEEKKRVLEVVSKMDTKEVPNLVSLVSDSKKQRDLLKDEIDNYKVVLEENKDLKSPKKRASLQAALKKKQEELVLVEKVLNDFENNLENKIIESKELLENNDLANKIASYEEEIASIKKEIALNSRSKDILALEKDKEELKKYNDAVSDILHRKKYLLTPNKIYEEIEECIENPSKVENTQKKEETVDLSAYKIDFVPEVEEKSKKEDKDLEEVENHETLSSLDDIFVPDVEPVSKSIEEPLAQEESKEESVSFSKVEEPSLDNLPSQEGIEKVEESSLDNLPSIEGIEFDAPSKEEEPREALDDIFPAVDILDEVPDYPPRVSATLSENVNSSNRYKVVEVEDLNIENEKKEEKVEELESPDFMINDFEDTDYISFNDLLEGDNHGN